MKKEKKDKLPEQGSESPFQRFEDMAKKVVSAPKEKTNKKLQNS